MNYCNKHTEHQFRLDVLKEQTTDFYKKFDDIKKSLNRLTIAIVVIAGANGLIGVVDKWLI